MDKSPFFSVVIPAYNRADFIYSTVQSVIVQSFTNFEILVIDDGSTDQTKEVTSKIHDPRFKYFYKENGERGAARNFGIEKSTGVFIVFLDSDDQLMPDCLISYFNAIQQNPSSDFFAVKYQIKSKKGIEKPEICQVKKGEMDYKDLLVGNLLSCNFCLRRLSKFNLFIEDRQYSTMEDWIFLMQNLNYQKLVLVNQIGVQMNDHANRSMVENHDRVIKTRLLAMNFLIEDLTLLKTERSSLIGNTYFFCAIHAYLGHSSWKSFIFNIKSVFYVGFRFRFFVMLLKTLLGKKNMDRIQLRQVTKIGN